MPPIKKIQQISPQDIVQILNRRFIFLMPSFYETQSAFLSAVYKKYKNIETANIVLCFARNMHLQILRQRENNLNFDVSLKNFWINFNHISKPEEKISSIVNITGIPKETTRRKIKNLLNSGIISNGSNKKCYIWNFTSKDKELYVKNINEQISYLARFIAKFSGSLNLSLNMKIIEEELRSQFSFYWYHFLSSQLIWLRMWQSKLKDNDLLLISLQATIPTLQFAEKHSGDFNVDNIFKIIGKTRTDINFGEAAVSATTVSEVTGIPRATCIRKLNKLVSLGFLLRETKTKRYFVNQNLSERTKHITTKENVEFTINTFSQFLATVLNSLIHNNSKKNIV